MVHLPLCRIAQIIQYILIDICLSIPLTQRPSGNTDEEKLESLIAAIEELKAKIGIKKTIREYGIDEADFLARLDEMVEQAFDDQCTGANPRYPLLSEIK